MKKILVLLAAVITLMAVRTWAQPAAAPADKQYSITKKAKVGGVGGFDYVYADADGRKLYIPRSGTGARTTVFNLDTLESIGTIANTPGDHGVAVDPKTHHGFVSCSPIVMFDSETLATIKTIDPQGGRPDGIMYEPFTQRIYVLSHSAPNVLVIDPKDGSVAGTIDLGGQPEQGQSDGAGHVYIDLEDKSQIAVVDATTMKATAHYDLMPKGGAPAGLGLDAKNHILFAMCATPANCVVLTTDGKILDALPIGAGVDSGGFNPATMEAFSSNGGGQGELTIIKENSPTSFVVEQKLQTMPGAKTCTLDSKTNRILLIATEMLPPTTAPVAVTPATQPAGAAAAGGRGAGRGGGRGARPTPAPDGFTILVASK